MQGVQLFLKMKNVQNVHTKNKLCTKNRIHFVYNMYTKCIQNVYKMYTKNTQKTYIVNTTQLKYNQIYSY